MALQVWLPLNGNLNNQGLAAVSVTNSGATVDNSGKIGKCYKFTTSQYMSLPYTGLSNASISFWIKLPSNKTTWLPFSNNASRWIMACDGGGNFYCSSDVTGAKTIYLDGNVATRPATDGNWHHYCITDVTFTGWSAFYINRYNSSSYNWEGSLNDVRIYDHCLSPKEVKEISKGLVLHYKLDDPYIENTVNLNNNGAWTSYTSYWTIESQKVNEIKLKKNTSTSSSTVALYNALYSSIAANTVVTVSGYLFKGDIPYKTTATTISNYGNVANIISWESREDGYFRYTFTYSSAATSNCLIHSALFGTCTDGQICYIRNMQWELKDHATPYTPSYRGIQTQYDKTLYQESDGSLWVRIAHHNNPANGNLFSQSDSFSTGVYKDADRWFDVYPTIRSMSKYEFMVKQKTTSSASEVKYRWVQNTSPLTAVYSNVAPSAVTRVTTSGYTDGGYGGLYILNSSTHLCIANTSNGNWFGAFGSWSSYSGGIPGYPNTAITSGYMDLYARVDGIAFPVYDCSGYERNGLFSGGISTQASEARYNICTKFNGSDTRIEVPFKYSNYGDNFTICAWVKSNVNSGGYLTAVGNELGTGGVVFAELGATNKLNCYLNGTSGADINVCSYNSFAANQWYHVVYSVQSALSSPVATLYINGVSVSTKSGTSAFGEPNEPVYIGCNRNYRYWNGNISDFRIYTTVLSADDIKDLYQTSASIHNTGTIDAFEFEEGAGNIAIGAEAARSAKTWADGLSSYTQRNCSCTLTDDGYRIYRPANKTVSGDGNTMWGGFVLDNGENNRFNFQKGHTYMLQFEVKGKTSNAVSDIYWANWVGWGGGGLSPSPSNVELCNPVTSNYNNSEWRTFTYKWTINDDVYKVCTSGYGRYTTGNTYMSYTGFKYGFSYTDTGSLGTELYIRNIRMFDITNGQISQIEKTGIVDFSCFTEEGEIAEITPVGMVGKQIIEI